jgi:hypothetical protein
LPASGRLFGLSIKMAAFLPVWLAIGALLHRLVR